MKGFLLTFFFYLLVFNASSQELTASEFLFASSFEPKKFENYLSKKKFTLTGSRWQRDTMVKTYTLKPTKKKNQTDSTIRNIETYQAKDKFSFAFITSSEKEYEESVKELKGDGFFCGNETCKTDILFQRQTLSVLANTIKETEGDELYSFYFWEAELPKPENVQHAEDLLQFYSHEQLVSFFGKKNVIKDIYHFSPKESSNCTVLFPKTRRQAVFIWGDEENLCLPSYLLIGGNLNTASSANYDGWIEENAWISKQGIYAGMTLSKLIRLNGGDFKFYGKDTRSPFMVVPVNTGALNFKDNMLVLGCLNPTGSALINNEMVSAGEILNDNAGIYVSMMMFLPPADAKKNKLSPAAWSVRK